MSRLERRDTLKLAGAAALASALTASGSSFAQGSSDEKPPASQAKKMKRKLNTRNLKPYAGIVTSVLAGNGSFTFGLQVGAGQMGFDIDDPVADELSVRVVLMAYEKRMQLTVFVDPNQPQEALLVSA
jgi:hypothetical protein